MSVQRGFLHQTQSKTMDLGWQGFWRNWDSTTSSRIGLTCVSVNTSKNCEAPSFFAVRWTADFNIQPDILLCSLHRHVPETLGPNFHRHVYHGIQACNVPFSGAIVLSPIPETCPFVLQIPVLIIRNLVVFPFVKYSIVTTIFCKEIYLPG